MTAGFVGFALKAYWKLRKSASFWGILVGALGIHLVAVGYFFYVGAGLSLLAFGPVVGIEWGCMALVI